MSVICIQNILWYFSRIHHIIITFFEDIFGKMMMPSRLACERVSSLFGALCTWDWWVTYVIFCSFSTVFPRKREQTLTLCPTLTTFFPTCPNSWENGYIITNSCTTRWILSSQECFDKIMIMYEYNMNKYFSRISNGCYLPNVVARTCYEKTFF